MDVSNSTGEDTQYRTGSGTTKIATWKNLPDRAVLPCPDPKAPWTIYFRLHDGTILSASYDRPMASVTLVKTKSGYRINAARKPVETLVKPARKPPAEPAKPAKANQKKTAA